MGDANPIRTFGDYSKSSHEGYRNTIELPVRNIVDLALYDNESWNDPRDFAKPIKAISLPQDVPSTSDRRLIELKNQVQRLMEAHIALTQSTQMNKITSSCEICSGSHDTQYCMEDLEQAFVEYASSHNNKVSDKQFTTTQDQETSKKPPTLGRTNQTLTGNELNPSQAHKKDRSPPIPVVTHQSLKEH
ncbi:hypothetical protein Tco_1188320 [Tanacetum coccineum]